ncbi:hypothetical protein [Deinococcus sonorensis]|uniref:Ig-like domain-containing protein n=2 Tax=Deinococcus sonorensis TaxID=309891 RepID=A0AAU7UAE6_9DEIO
MKVRVLPLLLLVPLLGACRYTFIPVIPPRVQVALPPRLTQATLKRAGDELQLSATLTGEVQPGYLTVVWMDQDREVGRDNVYLDAQQRQAAFRLNAPQKGSYRAMLFFGGTLLRQLDLRETGDL